MLDMYPIQLLTKRIGTIHYSRIPDEGNNACSAVIHLLLSMYALGHCSTVYGNTIQHAINQTVQLIKKDRFNNIII